MNNFSAAAPIESPGYQRFDPKRRADHACETDPGRHGLPDDVLRERAAVATAAYGAAAAGPTPGQRLAAIERASGGRLGVASSTPDGRTLFAHRADERFAMCSTFKLPLAAMFADGSDRTPLPIARADMMGNSPYSEQRWPAAR
ncbi:hypothetical protein [Allosphingosinicella sp.]|uniref:hypothetical protein n=1 Tax=Allosphingosinicella sp. TaxID=2823234 RepID=UPI0037845339